MVCLSTSGQTGQTFETESLNASMYACVSFPCCADDSLFLEVFEPERAVYFLTTPLQDIKSALKESIIVPEVCIMSTNTSGAVKAMNGDEQEDELFSKPYQSILEFLEPTIVSVIHFPLHVVRLLQQSRTSSSFSTKVSTH